SMWCRSGRWQGLRSERTVTRWCHRDGPHQAAGGPRDRAVVRPEPKMTLPRTVADVLTGHVSFEIESIDRMYLNGYVPRLQYATGIVQYIHRQMGLPVASTVVLAPITKAFVNAVHVFARTHQIPGSTSPRGSARTTSRTSTWRRSRLPVGPRGC